MGPPFQVIETILSVAYCAPRESRRMTFGLFHNGDESGSESVVRGTQYPRMVEL
jgi:hypothetical protein